MLNVRHFDLNGLDLFSLEVFHAPRDVRANFGAKLTEEFPSIDLEEAVAFQASYPNVYVNPDDSSDDHVLAFGNAFMLRRDDLVVLIDTGIGYPAPDAPYRFALPTEFAATGIAHEDVKIVLLTHGHPDHLGWVWNEHGAIFPNARHYFPTADLEGLRAQYPALYEAQIKPLIDAGRLELIAGVHSLAPGITTLPLPGHTPGQLGLRVEHDPPIIIAADALHYPMQVTHPEWQNAFDTDPLQAVRSRREIIAQSFESGAILCATHLETPGVGRVVARGDGQICWQPVQTG